MVFKEKSQMKSGGGLLFTAWLLLMAWCLFSNRVSTATVVGNSSLQVVTCKYLIFCSLDKYKLLVPHQVCAFAQKQLIELKSTLVGTLEAWLTLGWTPTVAVPRLSHHRLSSSHAFLYKLLRLGSNLVGEPPMGLPMPVRSRQSWPKRTSMLVPISPKRGIFSMGNANSRNQEKRKGGGGIFKFGKLNSHSLITQCDDMTIWHTFTSNRFLIQMFCTFTVVFLSFYKNRYWPYGTRAYNNIYLSCSRWIVGSSPPRGVLFST